jgi:ABC-type nitrate/sulfonate/bicarbonate transport system substrate-binding protein
VRRAAAVLAAILLAVAACGPRPVTVAPTPTGTAAPPEPVMFMAGFKAQANLPFVAVYVAQERGYFREQGLDVTIEHSAGQGEHVRLLGTGRVQFSTGSAGDVLKRVATSEVPIVSIALIGQRGEQAFAVRADSAIKDPRDWEGKLVGFKGTVSADYLALLKAAGVDRAKVREVAVGFDPRVLIERQVDVYPVFVSNEPDTLQRLGVPVRLFEPAAYGVRTLGLSLITNRDLVATRPDTVRRFLKAALRGLADAIEHRDFAIDAVMRQAPGEDRAHQRFMLDAEIDAALTDLTRANGLGWMTREQWQALQQVLLEFGGITRPVDLDAVVVDSFLKDVYREGRLVWP